MGKWVIFRLSTGTLLMLAKDHHTFTNVPEDAATFDTEDAAKAATSTFKTPLIVQQQWWPAALEKPEYEFPVPDYF